VEGSRLQILVTNDDGIYAEGLWALAREMSRLGHVTVVAPDREQSGIGTGISLGKHLRAHRATSPIDGVAAWAVEGTPGDAVILAIHALVQGEIDAVVSGINLGSNVGNDTVISGTVGAALQGFFNGIFSVAVSLNTLEDPDFDFAARLAGRLVAARRAASLPEDLFVNVNVPNLPVADIAGLVVAPVGETSYLDTLEEQTDPKGRRVYQIRRVRPSEQMEPDTDIWALHHEHAVLTPMRRSMRGDAIWSQLESFAAEAWDALRPRMTTAPA
jgi:5'-nucleotidase